MATPTTSWDETSPPGSQARSLGDDRIREMKTQLRELLAIDHTMSSSGSGATWGMHKIIQLLVQTTVTALADAGCLYTKDVNSKAELHFKDEDDNAIQITNGGVIKSPPGTIMMYGGATAPAGWLLCQGQAVSRTTYANLFAIVSTTFGSGDGSTTFNVPDLQDKFPIGKSGTISLGATGGGASHLHIVTPPATNSGAIKNTEGEGALADIGEGTGVSRRMLYFSNLSEQIPYVGVLIPPFNSASATNTVPSYQAVNYIISI